METYFDSRIDLIQRSFQKHSDRLKMKAEEFKIRDISGDVLAENLEREIKNFKLKVRFASFLKILIITRNVTGLDTHDAIVCVVAIGQSRSHPRKGLLFLWSHVTATLGSDARNGASVCIIFLPYETPMFTTHSDGFMWHIPCKAYTSFLCAHTSTRSALGTISSLTYATT
jgi:hypothetical protein